MQAVEAVKQKLPGAVVTFRAAFKDLLKAEIRNQRGGLVKDQTQRLNHVLFHYVKRLEELIADILEPNVLVRESCQLLTHAINTLTAHDENVSIASTDSRKRKTKHSNNAEDEAQATKRVRRYNLRSSMEGDEGDEVDQNNNSLPTSLHEQDSNDVQIIIQTPESQPKSPPSTISEEQEMFNIQDDTERATTVTTTTATEITVTNTTNHALDFNASMLDLVYEVIIDEQQQNERSEMLSPASPNCPSSPSSSAFKPIQENEACVQRIYKDLYSVCQRN